MENENTRFTNYKTSTENIIKIDAFIKQVKQIKHDNNDDFPLAHVRAMRPYCDVMVDEGNTLLVIHSQGIFYYIAFGNAVDDERGVLLFISEFNDFKSAYRALILTVRIDNELDDDD